MTTLTCKWCENSFETSRHVGDFTRFKNHFCSKNCQNKWQEDRSNLNTIGCEFDKCGTKFRQKDSKQRFCSRGCAIRFRAANLPSKPSKIPKNRGADYSTITLKQLRDSRGGRAATNLIRGNSRKVYLESSLPMECCACGYSRGIDICHIRPVADFPEDTPVSVVNDISNLMALDKLCHWEFDNGYLEFE